MDTPVRWNASISGDVLALQARWKEVRKGLKLVVLGYCFLILLAVPGLVLLFLSQALPVNPLPALSPTQVVILGWVLTGVGTTLMFGLLLLGQRRCLNHAPQLHGSRELMFICFLCTFVGAACLGISWGFGGLDNIKALVDILETWRHYPIRHAPELLQLAAALMFLLNCLFVTAFLRSVLKCVAPSQTGPVSGLFWAVWFLGGATIGLLMTPVSELLRIVSGAWVVAFLWHVSLILFTRRSIRKVLSGKADQLRVDERHKKKPPSGLQRLTDDDATRIVAAIGGTYAEPPAPRTPRPGGTGTALTMADLEAKPDRPERCTR